MNSFSVFSLFHNLKSRLPLVFTLRTQHKLIGGKEINNNYILSELHWKDFSTAPTAILKILETHKIDSMYLTKYPDLAYSKSGILDYNLKLMKELNLDQDAIVEMSLQNQSFVWKCYKACQGDLRKHGQHRIHFLSNQLEISHQTTCAKMIKYKFITMISMDRIKNIIEVLKEYQVDSADILSDLWILRCRSESVADRLSLVKEADVETIKPWMGRCRNSVFEKFMNRTASKQKLLGELSLEEYISRRLGCSAEEITEVVKRDPQLQRTSVLKIKKILDFLFLNGFSSSHILAGLGRVANRRIETINSRIQELTNLGVPPTLYILCKSRREYQHYINKRKKMKVDSRTAD